MLRRTFISLPFHEKYAHIQVQMIFVKCIFLWNDYRVEFEKEPQPKLVRTFIDIPFDIGHAGGGKFGRYKMMQNRLKN